MRTEIINQSNELLSPHANPLTTNDPYRGRTAPLTSKVAFYIFIQQIKVRNIFNMVYTTYSPFFSLQNSVCFIILTYLVPVLFTSHIQDVLKLKKIFLRQNVYVNFNVNFNIVFFKDHHRLFKITFP